MPTFAFPPAQVMIGKTRIGRTAAAVTIKNGALDIAVGEAEFYGGSIEGRLTAAPVGESLDAAARRRNSPIFRRWRRSPTSPGISPLDGIATVDLDVIAGRGRSWAAFANSATGTGTLVMPGGSMNGFDLPKIADELIDPLAAPVAGGGGSTAFASLAADLAIDDGSISTTGLVMRGSDFRLSLAGKGSLFTGAVEAKARLATACRHHPAGDRWIVAETDHGSSAEPD